MGIIDSWAITADIQIRFRLDKRNRYIIDIDKYS